MTTGAAENAHQEQEKLKQDVLKRMKRIEGQIRGIQRMIESGKECDEILAQVKAASSALQSSTKVIMRRYLMKCIAQAEEGNVDEREELEKLIKVMTNYIS